MTTSKDREQLHALNGTSAPLSRRESYPWKCTPTVITPSQHAPSMAHQSGTNPYGGNPNRRNTGNPTSARVLSMPSGPSPRKKAKIDHTSFSHVASAGLGTRQGDRNNALQGSRRSILLPPETIDVDDINVCDPAIPDDNTYMNSSDELNIRSPSAEEAHMSKYPFKATRHGSDVRHHNPSIVPDGESTEWLKRTIFQGSNDRNLTRKSPSGQVKEKVAKIEARNYMEGPPPKIDLAEKVKTTKMKNKMKNKNNKFFSGEQTVRTQPSRASAMKNVLRLKELYLDDKYFNNKDLEIHWGNGNGDIISIKSNGRCIFGPLDIRINGQSLTHDDASDLLAHDPIFQLKTLPKMKSDRNGTDVECLTIKMDWNNPDVRERYYTTFLEWLKKRLNDIEVVRGVARERIWEAAAWAEATVPELLTTGNSGKSRLDELRRGEPRRARRSLIDDQSKPLAPPKRSRSLSSSDLPEPLIPRRSTRNTSGATRSPATDSDEVILVYPPGVPGAVNITNGDLLRLQPEEFLNDTLIEFGLKLWLKDLEQTNPTLASEIHVFNSFFYKKLNHQKRGTHLGGYESVRKWTSKLDIFQKKYIIVPINEHLHWYFAIICEPEHVLVPAVSNTPSTRQQTRQLISEPMIVDGSSESPTTSKPVSTSVSENDGDEDKLKTPSEAEVEKTLHDFQGSCSISNVGPGENVADIDHGRSESPALSYVSEDTSKLRPLSPTASDHERGLSRHSPSDDKIAMDLGGNLSANTTNHDNLEIRPVDAASFYAPLKRPKGKRKAPEPEPFVMEIDNEDDGGPVLSDTPRTHIFIFDSLGGRHPQAINKLSAYLKMEAQDKKNIVNASNAIGKLAMVPSQPNFCDCGIYLLHFAQTFMSDPVHYRRLILAQKSKPVSEAETMAAWDAHQVTKKREDLAARINDLSREWKKERAAKEEAKQKEALNSQTFEVVESDGEIDILEPMPSAGKAKSGGKKKAGQKANRMRG